MEVHEFLCSAGEHASSVEPMYDKFGVSNRAGAVGYAFSIETKTVADQSADSR